MLLLAKKKRARNPVQFSVAACKEGAIISRT